VIDRDFDEMDKIAVALADGTSRLAHPSLQVLYRLHLRFIPFLHLFKYYQVISAILYLYRADKPYINTGQKVGCQQSATVFPIFLHLTASEICAPYEFLSYKAF